MTLFEPSEVPSEPARPDLPELRGSEAQCRWALDIRARLLRECGRLVADRRRLVEIWEQRRLPKARGARETLRRWVDRMAELERRDLATWWIDRREMDAEALLGGRG